MKTALQEAHEARSLMNARMSENWRYDNWVNQELVKIEKEHLDFTVLWPTGDTAYDNNVLQLAQQDPTNNKILIPQNNGNHWYGTAYTRSANNEWSAHTIHTRADGTCGDSLVEEAGKIAINAPDAQTNKMTRAPETASIFQDNDYDLSLQKAIEDSLTDHTSQAATTNSKRQSSTDCHHHGDEDYALQQSIEDSNKQLLIEYNGHCDEELALQQAIALNIRQHRLEKYNGHSNDDAALQAALLESLKPALLLLQSFIAHQKSNPVHSPSFFNRGSEGALTPSAQQPITAY